MSPSDTLRALKPEQASHWYTREGEPMHHIMSKAGTPRPTTIRDAKKLGLLPSVTNVLGIVSKPGLESWKASRYVRMALDHPLPNGNDPEEWIAKLMDDHRDEFGEAASRGTQIHAAIEALVQHLEGYAELPNTEVIPEETVTEFMKWYKDHGLHAIAVEFPVVNLDVGYAGTVDWIGAYEGHAAIIDWKTKKSEPGKPLTAWDEYGAQLAAYGMAADGYTDARLINVIISTTEPGRIAVHEWTAEEDECWAAFRAAHALWCSRLGKNWYPA